MHDVSKGPLARRVPFLREALGALLVGGFAVVSAGCPGPAPGVVGGAGGGTSTTSPPITTTTTPSSTATSTVSDSTSTSTVSESTVTGTVSGSTVTGTISTTSTVSVTITTACDLAQCQPQVQCDVCDPTTCTVVHRDAGYLCSQGGGRVCNGSGACVACNVDADCPPSTGTGCQDNINQAKDVCDLKLHACVPEDCSLKKQVCTTGGCFHCSATLPCPPGSTANNLCTVNQCLSGLCEAPVGAPCSSSGTMGTCGIKGTCSDGKYVFVSSKAVPGALGATTGPDYLCTTLAGAKGFPGVWKAWVSDATGTAISRFTNKVDGVPYRRLDGALVAADWKALDGTPQNPTHLQNPINLDESGVTLSGAQVWTGTNPDGSAATETCGSWLGPKALSGVVGLADATSGEWTHSTSVVCSTTAHFYCFQQ